MLFRPAPEATSKQDDEKAEPLARPAGAEPAEAEPAAPQPSPDAEPGQKVMRLEDIKDLPILKRYHEIPIEKGGELLGDVKDETFGYDESAFWWVVHLVTRLPAEAFDPGEVTTGFSQLLAMPSSYRGEPVTIRGAYVSCAPFEPPVLAIRKDVPTLYECNIRELPLEEHRPVATVIVTEDPMEYLRVWDVVKVRGYFYKVRSYQGSKGPGLAPMLVSQRLVPEGFRSTGEAPGGWLSAEQVLLVFMIGGILLLGFIYIFLRQKTKATPHAAHQGAGHRIRLRRPDRDGPSADTGPGGEGGRPQS